MFYGSSHPAGSFVGDGIARDVRIRTNNQKGINKTMHITHRFTALIVAAIPAPSIVSVHANTETVKTGALCGGGL